MTKTVSMVAAATLALLPVAASAETPAPRTITYAGETYTCSVTEKNGIRTIRGVTERGFKPFTLVVGKHAVSGTVGGMPVSFPLSSVKPLVGTVEVAAR
jgi:hypothetical protein